jgi:3-deoxy-D-manno-octulosonic-acid transferase
MHVPLHKLYFAASALLSPIMPLWLELRRLRGKEDSKRSHERFGIASYKRPVGMFLWIHAASVGEANSVLYFIEQLRKHFPDIHILVTTGTVTSAKLMAARLPGGVIHQYIPVDTPQATHRFMRHWRPDVALWVESELWPNLIASANRWNCTMGIINGRMSDKSFRMWNKYPSMSRPMIEAFDVVFAQSGDDAKRFEALGAKRVFTHGNMKYDARPLACNEEALLELKRTLGNRPIWLAASTHPGEEAHIIKAHNLLKQTRKNLLTIIVPRHPSRGDDVANLTGSSRSALRSRNQSIAANTEFYIADTLGELGLFYRLSDVVFMGGSLIKHGGQNPLEPAHLASAILTGTHTHNFKDIYAEMEKAHACIRVNNAEDLAAQISALFGNASRMNELRKNAKAYVEAKSGATEQLIKALTPVFSIRG